MMMIPLLFFSIAVSSHSNMQVLIRLSTQWDHPTRARQTNPAPVFVLSKSLRSLWQYWVFLMTYLHLILLFIAFPSHWFIVALADTSPLTSSLEPSRLSSATSLSSSICTHRVAHIIDVTGCHKFVRPLRGEWKHSFIPTSGMQKSIWTDCNGLRDWWGKEK